MTTKKEVLKYIATENNSADLQAVQKALNAKIYYLQMLEKAAEEETEE